MVKIKRVKIKNFRIHRDLELEFEDGTNILIGENGTGKTSVFLAIIFCLFGPSALTLYERGRRKENLLRRGSTSGFVELEIQTNDGNYIIKRFLPSGDAYIAKKIDGKERKIVIGSENVTKHILNNYFNVKDIGRIINIIFIRQRTLGNLILETGKKTFSEKLEEILDLKKYTELYEILKSILKDVEERILETKKEISVKEGNISKILKGRSLEELEDIVLKRKEIEKKIKELEILKAKKESLEKYIDKELVYEEEKIKEKIDIIKENINKIDEELNKIREKLKYLRILREDFKDLLSKNLTELFNIRKKLFKEVKDLDKEKLLVDINFLEERISNIKDKNLDELERKLDDLKKSYEDLRKRRSEIEGKINVLIKVIDIIKKSKEPKCPVCGSKIENPEKLYNEKEKEYALLKNNLREVLDNMKENERRIKEIEREINIIRKNIEDLKKKIMIEVYDPKEFLDIVEKYLKDIKEKYKKVNLYERVVSAISYIQRREFEETMKELLNLRKEYEKEIENLTKKITKISEMKKKMEELRIINEKIEELGIKDLDKEIENLKKELEKLPDIGMDALSNLKKELENLDKLREYLNNLSRYYEILKAIVKILSNFRLKLRKEIAKRITDYLNYWFRKIYVYPDIKRLEIKVVEGKTDFVYEIFVRRTVGEKEVEVPLAEIGLSGGQVVSLDLALRLAFASFVSKSIYFILLDEPTESLDERIRRKISEVLKNLKNVQILVSTHDDIFKEALSGRGYYFKREGNEIIVKEII